MIVHLIDGLDRQLADIETKRSPRQRALEMSRTQLLALVRDAWLAKVRRSVAAGGMERWARRIAEKRCDPYSAAERIVEQMAMEIAGY